MSTAENNIFARDGFYWWIGVVEDREDPKCAGRCRVRILGYHIDNKITLPTEDLPWALPMQPITSAALSGKGSTPIGPLEGTWVIGFFADGKDCQQPIIMGTLAGIPPKGAACEKNAKVEAENEPSVLTDSNGNIVRDENGDPQKVEPTTTEETNTSSNSIRTILPPLTQTDIQNLMDALGARESSSQVGGVQNYDRTNSIGYVGKYQFGIQALQSLGYVIKPISDTKLRNSDLNTSSNWTGKNSVTSIEDWKVNKNNCQEIAMFELLEYNYKILEPGTIDAAGERGPAAGYLAAAHLLGPGGARALKNGSIGKDGNGVSGTEYYELGVASVNGIAEEIAEAAPSLARKSNTKQVNKFTNPFGALNDPKLGQPDPYSDPNSVYPECDYTGRPDTNKLACSEEVNLDDTIIGKKKDRGAKDINIANNEDTWDEPAPAYCAKYPYNHVIESESGHVIEMDDTPGRERLHIYHRTGTHIEIDQNGTVRQHVEGDNYEVMIRNNRLYTRGAWDLTVDGPATLLAKDALNIEVFGNTIVNIHNNVDINIAGQLNLKAQNINIEAQQDINIRSGNYTNVKAGGDLNFRADGDEQHNISGSYDLDASDVNLNSGTANATEASQTGLDDLPELSPDGAFPTRLVVEECTAQESAGVQNDAGENEDFAEEAVAAGIYTPQQVEQGKQIAEAGCARSDTNTPTAQTSTSIDGSEFNNFTDFPDTTRLSRSFTLGEVSNRVVLVSEQNKVQSQRGLTKQQIVTNLKGLCCNVLDPIRAKYPNMFVTNAFRIGSGTSQHETGEAADLQFKGASKAEYYDIALWIRDSVAYDQLILEYKTTGTGNPWIHVSHKNTGNRPATDVTKVMTFMNHKKIKAFLCDLSR
jgi:hypothetical protein